MDENQDAKLDDDIAARKNAVVRFRVSQYQAEVLHAAARLEGLTMSAWARQIVFKQAGLLDDV